MSKKKSILFSRTSCLSFVSFLLMLSATPAAYAAADPTIVTGSKNLAGDALKWVLILVPVAAAFWMGYHALRKLMADGDAGSIAVHNKAMKNVLIGAIVAESASGIVTLVLSYY